MDSYVLGQPVIISASFTVSGTPTDPTDLTLSVQAAEAASVVYTFGVDSEIVTTGTGLYEATITPAVAGRYRYRWLGEGVAPGAIEGEFTITSIFAPVRTLVARMRAMIGDTATSPTFTDLDLAEILALRRTDVYEAQLSTRQFSALGTFVDYTAPRRWWADDAVLTDTGGTVLSPDVSDPMAGHWTFTAGQNPPVFISGSFYDLYGSAADACNEWAARVAREFDFATDQQSFDRTGKREGLIAVAREFTRKAVQPGRRPAWRSLTW